MAQPTQVLPYWLSVSTSFVTTDGNIFPTPIVVNLPLTYYGPSIPLGSGWVYGGSTSPAPSLTASPTATDSSTALDASTASSPTNTLETSETPSTPTEGLTSESSASSSETFPAVSGTIPTTSAATTSAETSSSIPSSISNSVPASSASTSSVPRSFPSTTPTTSTSSTFSSFPSHTSTTSAAASASASLASFGNRSNLSKGAIIALATGLGLLALALLALCGILVILRWRKRHRRPNGGRPLEGHTSSLPPAFGDEHGSLLAGRRSGGESPELGGAGDPEMSQDIRHLPIAHHFITERIKRDSASSLAGGSYRSLRDAAPGPADGPIAAAAIGAASRSRHGTGTDESGGTVSSRGVLNQPSSSHNGGGMGSPRSDLFPESDEAEVVTAQRATRSPLARLARLSWFRRNSDAFATTDELEDDDWVEVPHSRRGVATPLLAPAPGGSRSAVSLSRPGGAALPLPLHSPPPASYLRVGGRPQGERRASAQTVQSSSTVFYDADSRPSSPPILQIPLLSGPRVITPATDSGNESSPGDDPTPPTGIGGSQPWPRFASPAGGDHLDSPVPGRYSRTSHSGGMSQLPSPWAAMLGVPTVARDEEAMRRRSAPDLTRHPGRGELSTLDEAPPMAAESWRRRLGESGGLRAESEGSRRLTLGPASFVDTPRLVTQPETSSMHGDLRSQYGASIVGSSNPSNPSIQGRSRPPHSPPGSRATDPGRMPSLSAIRSMGAASPTATSTAGSGSEPVARSDTTRVTTEVGELTASSAAPSPLKPILERPAMAKRVPTSLTIQPDVFGPDGSTPPPPLSAFGSEPSSSALTPPPARSKPWWKSPGQSSPP